MRRLATSMKIEEAEWEAKAEQKSLRDWMNENGWEFNEGNILIDKYVEVELMYGLFNNRQNVVTLTTETPVIYGGKEFGGFYISFLIDSPNGNHGCTTTALVLGQMQRFFILKGDHRKQYAELFSKGFEACLDYYRNNIHLSHKNSDKIV